VSGNIFNSNGTHVAVLNGAEVFDLDGQKIYELKGTNLYRLSGELVGHLNSAHGTAVPCQRDISPNLIAPIEREKGCKTWKRWPRSC
jgi:hypothetical protein